MPPQYLSVGKLQNNVEKPEKSGFLRIKLTYSIYNAKLNVQSIFCKYK